MDILPDKIIFNKNLIVLCKVLKYFLPFRLNKTSGKLEESKCHHRVASVTYNVLLFLTGGFMGTLVFIILKMYLIGSDEGNTNNYTVKAQERALFYGGMAYMLVSIFVYIGNYIQRGPMLMITINEMMNIFNLIKDKTDGTIYYLSDFQTTFILMHILYAFHFVYDLKRSIFLLIHTYNIGFLFGQLVCDITHWSYFYIHLVLICFHLKMSEVLKNNSHRDSRNYSHIIARLVSISFRIHRVKINLDKYFWMFFSSKYLGVLVDINLLYGILLRIYKLQSIYEGNDLLWAMLINYFTFMYQMIPMIVSISYDVYLIGKLSDMLIDADRMFKENMLLLSLGKDLLNNESVQRDIDLVLMQTHLQSLGAKGFYKININRMFWFQNFLSVIIINVIVCFQYFLGSVKGIK